MYDELINRLRELHPEEYDDEWEFVYDCQRMTSEAADAIEELTAERDKYKRHSDAISQLPDCNTCGKKAKGICEFMPAYGDWVRINCAFWIPEQPKEET